ncbi:MAG TPA: M1 family metallopeptidase [Anaerolineaceae bacterium]|nr:M1 family metallopeptidase [Anaerolineaceae bacterium]
MKRSTSGLILSALLLILLLAACRTPAPVATLTPPELPPPQFHEGREIYRLALQEFAQPVLAELPGATEYRLDLVIASDYRSLQGHEVIRYTNRESENLAEIYLRLFPNIAGGNLTVSNVTIAAQPVQPVEEANRSALRLPLAESLVPGAGVDIELDFWLVLPEEMGGNYGLLGFFDDVLVLDTFYPVIPVYDDQGWHAAIPPGNGDLPYYDVSFYQVRVAAPAALVLAASGIEAAHEIQADWQTTTYVIGPARDFYLAGSELFQRTSETIAGVTITSYALPEWEASSHQAVDIVAASLEHYGTRFGRYPYTDFDIVSTPMLALGIEYPAITAINLELYDPNTIIRGIPAQLMFESVTAHEMAHQWFYNLVGNDQIGEPWLDEALAQYCTYLYYLDAHDLAAADEYRGEWISRWARVNQEDIPIGLSSGEYAANEYSPIVYGRGPVFLFTLAETMGADRFDSFLATYARTYQWEIATTTGFKTMAEQACACDLTPLFTEWVYGP